MKNKNVPYTDQWDKSRKIVAYIDDLIKDIGVSLEAGLYKNCPYKEIESMVNYLEKSRMAANNILIRYGDNSMTESMPKIRIS